MRRHVDTTFQEGPKTGINREKFDFPADFGSVREAACVKFSKIDQGVGHCSSAKIDILLFDRQNHPISI